MKQEILRLLVAMAIMFACYDTFSQDLARDRYDQLDKFLNYLNSKGVNEADEVLMKTQEIVPLCPSLEGIVTQFKSKKSESTSKISERLQRRNQLDLSVQVTQIEGTVESQTKGCSIINSKGSLIAVRANVPVGSSYKAYVKRGSGTVTYKPLGGSTQTLQTYVPVSGGSPQEHYCSLTKEIDNLQTRYNDLWEKFKMECRGEVSSELLKAKQELLNKHYALGENFLAKKEYDSALVEFTYVKTLDVNFKDVSAKLDLANNNNEIVRQSDVYQIVSPKQNYFLIGTSQGLFESSNSGKTWKLRAFPGMKVLHLDAMDNVIVLYDEGGGTIQHSADAGNTWNSLVVSYTLKKRNFRIFQPRFQVEVLRLVPPEMIFIKYIGSKGVYQRNGQTLQVEKDLFGDYGVWVDNRKEFIEIPERCLSRDAGNTWIPFHKFLGSYLPDSDIGAEAEGWASQCVDYSEEPEDAVKTVIRIVAKRKQVDEDQIKAIACSQIRKLKKDRGDRVLVPTNYGLYKTCWDCEQVEEVTFPGKGKTPITVFSDSANPNLIMIGLEGHGLLISGDGGLTWEEI
jgi:hypothetical protein